MPIKYLLDTDIVSFLINNRFPKVREKLQRVPFDSVAISVITEAELRFGVARKPEALGLAFVVEECLAHVEILPWDSSAAKQYSAVRTAMEREGSLLGSMDMMIAAHALAAGCVLVTHDRGFSRVKALKTTDWTRP